LDLFLIPAVDEKLLTLEVKRSWLGKFFVF